MEMGVQDMIVDNIETTSSFVHLTTKPLYIEEYITICKRCDDFIMTRVTDDECVHLRGLINVLIE